MPDFEATYICNKSLPQWGFTSWDDFFTRKIRDGARPITEPNNPAIVTAACDTTTYQVVKNIKEEDTFWIEDNHTHSSYLELANYHHWHAPVAGTVVKILDDSGNFFPSN
ncbi:hypothetical protein BBP40_004439 [Aspergillus hancockii]|nr:hypothetical protein BBP40_004439 [Aspergillus hancockii]